MSLYRVVGAALVLVSCTAFGFYSAYRLGLRNKFLRAFLSLLSRLETGVRYSREDIVTLIKASSPKTLSACFPDGDDPRRFLDETVGRFKTSFNLNSETVLALEYFASFIGSSDVDGQINHLRLCQSSFEQLYNNSLEEYKTKSRLYKILGFFAGAALALVML